MSSLLLAAVVAAATPVPADDPAPTITAEQALANARALTSAVPPKVEQCPETTGDEIVVCAKHADPATQHVPSDTDQGVPDDGGIPRAPNVSTLPDCATASFCSRMGRTPVHPLLIDLKAIPEPPAGSDADKIAKGEMAPP